LRGVDDLADEMLDEKHKPTDTETPEKPSYSRAARISAQMVQLTLRAAGRGPTHARTSINTNFVLVVLDDVLTRAERSLLEAGERTLVRQQRDVLSALMRDAAIAIVETEIGRSVRSLLTDVDPDRGTAVLVFLFEPSGESESGELAVAEIDRGTTEDELAG
jgi:uncharacterized protein YbcI